MAENGKVVCGGTRFDKSAISSFHCANPNWPISHDPSAMLEAADAPVAGFAPVDPAELTSAFDVIADRYGEQRARRLFMRLGKVADWPTEWRPTLALLAVLPEEV